MGSEDKRDSILPGSNATLAVRACGDEDPHVELFDTADDGENYTVSLIGRGKTVPDALREAADRIESGEEDLMTMDTNNE